MNKLFDINNPFMRALSRFADLVMLSFFWFVSCLPVITIGPASAALCFVSMKIARKEDIRVGPTFFQSFKVNFKQGVILNFIFILLGAIVVADLYWITFIQTGTGTGYMLMQALFIAMGIWLLCVIFYTYPLQAQFYNPIRTTIRNATVLAMQHPLNTIIVFILNLFPVLFLYVSIRVFRDLTLFVRMAPLWVLLAPGLLSYLCGRRFVKIFDPYLNPEKSEDEEEEEE